MDTLKCFLMVSTDKMGEKYRESYFLHKLYITLIIDHQLNPYSVNSSGLLKKGRRY